MTGSEFSWGSSSRTLAWTNWQARECKLDGSGIWNAAGAFLARINAIAAGICELIARVAM
jgi:hypothetical protein